MLVYLEGASVPKCWFQEHFLFFGIVERTGPHLAQRHARAWCCCLLSTRGSTTAASRQSSSEVIMSVGTVVRPVESRGVYESTVESRRPELPYMYRYFASRAK